MAAIVNNAFGGERPITQPRLLNDSEAQVARNCRLVSGRIEPLKGPSTLSGAAVITGATTLFRYGNSSTESQWWMSWVEQVHACRSPIANDQYDRLYWTGEGSGSTLYPRYAPSSLVLTARAGGSYPGNHYRLGIPKPAATITASGTAVVNPTVVSREYVITYTNAASSPTLESLPSAVYTVSAVDGGDVVFTNLPTSNGGDTRVTHKRLYRKVSGTYRLITTQALSVTTYTDNMTDATAGSQTALSATLSGAITSPAVAPRATAASGSGVTETTETRTYFVTVTDGRFTVTEGDGGTRIITFPESYQSAEITASNVYQKQSVSLTGFNVPGGLTFSKWRIYRKRGSETFFKLIGEVASGTTSFTDTGAEPDVVQGYGGASYESGSNKPGTFTATLVTPYTPTTSSIRRVYCVTFVNGSGTESAASPASNGVTVLDGNTVTVTHTESVPTGVTLKRLYRKLETGAASTYKRVAEFSSSQTSHTDSATDASISGASGLPTGLVDLLPKPSETPTLKGNIPATVVPEARTYVYTYVSAYGEEGPPSTASTVINIDPNKTVNLSNMSAAPSGAYNVTLKRIYRSSTVGNQAQFQFVAEIPVATTTYADTKTQADLGEVLPSETWEPPPDKLFNLRIMANGIACGFVKDGTDRTVVLSEPYLPHAWPPEYSFTTDDAIVGIGVFRQSIAVLTESFPYIIYGVDPSAMSMTKLELPQACVSAKSIVETGDGVIYASPDGLISISSNGAENITKNLYTRDQWNDLRPETMQCFYHDGRIHIFCTDASGTRSTRIIDLSGQGAVLTRSNIHATTAVAGGYYDPRSDTLYFIQNNTITRHNRGSDLEYLWRSKVFKAPYPLNFSCGQVLSETYPVIIRIYANSPPTDSRNTVFSQANPPTALAVGDIWYETDNNNQGYRWNGTSWVAFNPMKIEKVVYNANIFTLPSGFRAQDWYYEVYNNSTVGGGSPNAAAVYSVSIAQSYAEIKAT